MRLILIHYHLRPGGVTSVILNSLKALDLSANFERIIILTGEHPSDKILNVINGSETDIDVVEDRDIGYLSKTITKQECIDKYDKIKRRLTSLIDNDTIIHIHNPGLGKNPVLSKVLYDFASTGQKILYQIHDFAEEQRIDNYLFNSKIIETYFRNDINSIMFPDYKNVLFTVLNHRDYNMIINAGIPAEKIELLPNCIPSKIKISDNTDYILTEFGFENQLPVFLYPVRGIRRKNIGEFIFYAVFFAEKANFILSLEPKNPVEKESYNQWKQFIEKNNISNIKLNVGHNIKNVGDSIFRSYKVLTTSVAEGFGMVFLEPWLCDTAVIGRNIPGIVSEFEENDIHVPVLYNKLWIPSGWIDNIDTLLQKYYDFILYLYNVYNLSLLKTELKQRIKKVKIVDNKIDFSDLDIENQIYVIKKIFNNPTLKPDLIELNSWIDNFFDDISDELIKSNKDNIHKHYSVKRYSQKLTNIYIKLDADNNVKFVSKKISDNITRTFLDIENIKLILT